MQCPEHVPHSSKDPGRYRRILLAVVLVALGSAAVIALASGSVRVGRTALMGDDDIASSAMHDIRMLAQAKKRALGEQIKAAGQQMKAFDAKFDEAFNKGWQDAGKRAREVRDGCRGRRLCGIYAEMCFCTCAKRGVSSCRRLHVGKIWSHIWARVQSLACRNPSLSI